ncbi:glycosyltransferase family 4 protein [Anthocerotibacter panamensis]|uniref:glycosyltransferase family 4 protein n=1 Tax=Anthocerotibacter panamensis TaxID=2857077 RepID=UPI001C408557|nr:glycosyltransferase family 4 protein [Anthocerotibacter panamensis]
MKILLAAHNVVKGDGQGRVNYELARHLSERGHQVTLLADRVDPGLLDSPNLTWEYLKAQVQLPNLIRGLIWAHQCNRFLQQKHAAYDIVHLNGIIAYVPHHLNTCHFVHGSFRQYLRTERSPGLRGHYHQIYSDINFHLERKYYPIAQRVVAVSPKTKRELEAIVGLAPQQVDVICNGVDLEMFYPDPRSREQTRKALGIRPDTLALLYIGDYTQPRKGLRTLLQAMADTPQAIQLYVVGKGLVEPYRAQLAGIRDQVHFLGFRADTPQLYRAADIFVYPSRYDTFSLVVLEALASGTAVMTTRASGFGELMTADRDGFILEDPYDWATLRQGLLLWYRERETLARIAAQGRLLAQDYSWRRMAEDYEALYEQVLHQPIPARRL